MKNVWPVVTGEVIPRTAVVAAKNQAPCHGEQGIAAQQAKDALSYREGRIAAAVPRGLPRYRGRCPGVGAVGSATLASHFGASLEDHGPNVVH
jgi:hypothetical protein